MKAIFIRSVVIIVGIALTKQFVLGDNHVPLALMAVTGAMYIVSSVASHFTIHEKSEFFRSAVSSSYEPAAGVQVIEAYDALKINLMDKVEAKLETDVLEADWVQHLEPKQLQVLRSSLLKRMHRNIVCLVAIERDKPNQLKLWRHKLLSEERWESLLQCEKELATEIEECMLESEELKPGWRETLFQEALTLWRQECHRKREEEREREKLEEAKRAKENEIRMRLKEQRTKENAERHEEKLAEKLAEQLAREEQQEAERAKKKGGKKKK